jgi:hypothetical protein
MEKAMYTMTSKFLVKILSTLTFIFGLYFSQSVMATENETACKEHIQNKIAWNYDGQKQWESENIERLCRGTDTPNEPGECFNKAMQNHVEWGGSDKWEWQNAVSLCAGTGNAARRISCFKKRIVAGETWDAAIFQCQSNGNLNNKVPM